MTHHAPLRPLPAAAWAVRLRALLQTARVAACGAWRWPTRRTPNACRPPWAGAAWSAPVPQPVWLLLLPGCDHYLVAGLGEVQQENPAWGTLTSAIQAFVRQEDEYLNKTACTSLTTAEPAASSAISPVCARRSMRSIVTAEPAFQQWAAAEPLSATTLARGLRRWLGWVGEEPAGVVTDWIRHHQHSEECV